MSALQLRCSPVQRRAVLSGCKRHKVVSAAITALSGRAWNEPVFAWKRRGRDSNPRRTEMALNGFQDRRIRPLCHPSGRFKGQS